MIKKIFYILLIVSIGVLFCFLTDKKEEEYKILKVIEGDKFYVDLNKNNITDEDELIHLKDVNSFPLRYNSKLDLYAKRFNISQSDVLTLGYMGKLFSEKYLLNKNVKIEYLEDYNPEYEYRFGTISLDDVDYSLILVYNGFGFSYNGINNNYYKVSESIEKIKENLEFSRKYNLKIIDKMKHEFHELNCPFALYNKSIEISPRDKIDKNYTKCKYCYLPIDFKEGVKKYSDKLEISDISKRVGDVELFLIYPNSYFVKSNKCRSLTCKTILKNINNSKESIHFALYGIEGQDEILKALISAKKRGVEIKGVVDSETSGSNIYHDTYKLKKNFTVVDDKNSAIMHNKFMIFDNKTVFTGSVNFSSSGLGAYNSNSALLIHNKKISEAYECEFKQMYNGDFHTKKKIDCSLSDISLPSNIKSSIYFSPRGDVYQNVFSPLIKNAKSEILISIFYLTHKGIISDLIEAKKRGVKIKIIMDSTSANNPKSGLMALREGKIFSKVEDWGGKNHEKTMVVDSQVLVLGSANFTASGMNKNDENVVVMKNFVLAKTYKDFFLKLYSSIDDKYTKIIPRPEGFESGFSCFDGLDNDYDKKIDEKDSACQIKNK